MGFCVYLMESVSERLLTIFSIMLFCYNLFRIGNVSLWLFNRKILLLYYFSLTKTEIRELKLFIMRTKNISAEYLLFYKQLFKNPKE